MRRGITICADILRTTKQKKYAYFSFHECRNHPIDFDMMNSKGFLVRSAKGLNDCTGGYNNFTAYLRHQNLYAIKEKCQHGSIQVPYSYYDCGIPDYFTSVPLHWHSEMELNYIKSGNVFSNTRIRPSLPNQETSF